MKYYTMKEASELLQVSPSTLRYYDKEGLLPMVKRSEAGYRIFSEDDIAMFRMIGCLKKTGMQIKEIKQFTDWVQMGDESLQKRYQMFVNQRKAVKERIKDLEETLKLIEHKCEYYEHALGGENGQLAWKEEQLVLKEEQLASEEGLKWERERFDKQVQFILEADKEKNILRQTHLSGNGRRENDAEHAWHMAMMTYLLKEYANEEIDTAKTMMMTLIHDIVEIDAGDTYAYDENGLKTQKEREEKAAERIFGLLPEDQCRELRGLFEEFEAYETPEACFAHTMDNFQPMLLNDSNGGGDWKDHGVCERQVRKRNAKTHTGSEQIWTYMEETIKKHVAEGNLKS